MQKIFVGDVQGCSDELDTLLARAIRTFGDDFELWCVGDLVNRGPHSRRVLERVGDLAERGRARVVLGNHDLALLRLGLGVWKPRSDSNLQEILEAPDCDAWVEWLRRRPVVETGALGTRRFAMVHAAVRPDWSLDELERRAERIHARLGARDRASAREILAADPKTDPDADALALLTHCRSVPSEGGWRPQEPDRTEDAWHRRWSAREHPYAVVYGHWSAQGLHVAPALRGLDTGLVHHRPGRRGWLTAWLPDTQDADPFRVPDHRFWQIPALRRYR